MVARQEAAIRQEAKTSAAQIVRRAEDRATTIVANVTEEASAHIASARERAQGILGDAEARREQILAELTTEAAALQQRIAGLQRSQARLHDAYDAVERTLAEARRALKDTRIEPAGERPSATGDAGRPILRNRRRSGGPALTVFDGSPSADSAAMAPRR